MNSTNIHYRIFMYGQHHPDETKRGLVAMDEPVKMDSEGYPVSPPTDNHVFLYITGDMAGIRSRLNDRLTKGGCFRNNGYFGPWTMLLVRNCLAYLNGSAQTPWTKKERGQTDDYRTR